MLSPASVPPSEKSPALTPLTASENVTVSVIDAALVGPAVLATIEPTVGAVCCTVVTVPEVKAALAVLPAASLMLLSLALRLSCTVPLPLPVATVTCQAVPEPVTPVMLSPASVPPSAKSLALTPVTASENVTVSVIDAALVGPAVLATIEPTVGAVCCTVVTVPEVKAALAVLPAASLMLLSLALRLSCTVPLPLPVATVTCQAVPEPVTPVMLSPASVPPSAKSLALTPVTASENVTFSVIDDALVGPAVLATIELTVGAVCCTVVTVPEVKAALAVLPALSVMLLSPALRLSCTVPLPLPVAPVTCQAVPEPVTPVMLSPASV